MVWLQEQTLPSMQSRESCSFVTLGPWLVVLISEQSCPDLYEVRPYAYLYTFVYVIGL